MSTIVNNVMKFANIIILLTQSFYCHDNITYLPVDTSRVKLTLIDVAVKEVYLNINIVSASGGEIVIIQRGGVIVKSFILTFTDTILADTGLTQNTNYIYQAMILANGKIQAISNKVTTCTLLPTSHNFTWQTFVLGGGDDSYLHGVTIVDENNIWAVGEVSLRDSNGQIEYPSNGAVHWDGNSYGLKRLPAYDLGYTTYLTPWSAIGFSQNEIWFVGGGVHLYDGNAIQLSYWISPFPGNPNPILDSGQVAMKIWGKDNLSLFVVGSGGALAYFDRKDWRKINSGTTAPINDIWGVTNPASGKEEVYCAVSDIFQFKDRKILKLVDGQVEYIPWDAQRDVVLTLWTNRGFPMYVGGGLGLYENKASAWQKVDFIGTNVYPSCIRGTGLNNIVIVGSFGLAAHYNGIDWKILTDVYDAAYSAVAIKGTTVAAVGSKNGRAILTIGKQN